MRTAFRLRRGFGVQVAGRPSALEEHGGHPTRVGPAAAAGPGCRPCEGGQTPTEYLMIAGIMTMIGILVLLWMFQPWRKSVQDVTDCVRTDDCEATHSE